VLEHAIKKQLDDVELGKREHGLLLVARLASKLVSIRSRRCA
jgi:hypothetical protein